ncbi:hypothetical protein D3C73_747000 [compost metagenome]
MEKEQQQLVQQAEKEQEQQLVHQTEVAQGESAEALARVQEVPLQVRLGSRIWTFQQDQYEWQQDRIEVPLRLLIEQMGGKVSWNEEKKTASAHYGVYDIEYDLPTYSVRVFTLGKPTATYAMAPTKLDNGSIRVSLSGTVEQLGSRVSIISQQDNRKEVAIDFRKGLYVRNNLHGLPKSLFALL